MIKMRRDGKTLRAISAALEAKGLWLTVAGVKKVLDAAGERTAASATTYEG